MGIQSEDYMSLVALILVLFIMMIFSFAILLVGLFNIKKIIKSSILFYGLLGSLMLFKIVGDVYFAINFILVVLGIQNDDQKNALLSKFESFYKNSMYGTDFVIVSLFLILMKKFHLTQYQALLNKSASKIKNIWIGIQLLQLIAFTILISLFNFEILNFTQTTISIAILNMIPSTLYIGINLHANITMTGAVTQPEITARLQKSNKRLFLFFLSRAFEGTYQFILSSDLGNTPFVNVILNIEETKGQPIVVLACFGIYLIVILLTQLIPFVTSVRASTMQLMQTINTLDLKQSILSSNSSFINLIKKTQNEDIIEKDVDMKQFQIIQVLSAGQNMFGIVKKGKMRGRLMVLRTIDAELSKYLNEEIATQIQERKNLNIQGLIPIRYSLLEPKYVSFLTDYYDLSLKKVIESKKSLNQSVRMMYQLCCVVNQLHKINLPHGTLKINNIYLSGTHIKIADHGLLSLKKFMSITQGYCNKSIYTAPELLSGRYTVIVKPTKQGDVYALGMIMFEVFTRISVYRTIPIHEIEVTFKQKQTRPKIPGDIPSQLQNLIRNCWQQQPSQRLSIQQICIILREYKNKLN